MRPLFVVVLVSVAALVAGPAAAQTHSELQERHCTGDAFRLCASEIPDESRIIACMTRQRHRLSAACNAVFDDPAPVSQAAAPTKPRKPTQLVPQQ